MEERARQLRDHCREQIGDGLRAVYTYGPEGHTVVYTREDVEYGYTEDRLASLVESVSDIHETLTGMGTDKEPLGVPQASIQVFEYGFVVLFVDGQQGVAVSVDREVGPEISEFLDSCRTVFQRV